MAEHIDRHLLDTDIRYRFNYLSKFLNFTDDDILILNTVSKVAHPLIPTVVECIYQKLLESDITKKFFLTQNFGYEGTMITDGSQLTIKSEQMIFRMNAMRKYLQRVLRQRIWNDAFLDFLSNVGKMHTNKAGSHSIDVDYMHIGVLFGYVEHILIDAVLSHEEIDDATKRAALLALNKFFWIQNDFFSMHYITPSKN